MHFKTLANASALLLIPLSMASPLPAVRANEMCGQYDTTTAGDYIIYNNLWNKDTATSGSQCTEVTGIKDDNTLSWRTTWSWEGDKTQVKSYANAKLEIDPKQLSALKSIPFTWKWSYKGENLIADVAFDIWTSSSTTGDYEYEIMIWLGRLGGAGPIGDTVSTFEHDGTTWELHEGSNGSQKVYSFVAAKDINDMQSDALPFLQHLVDAGKLDKSQYLRAFQSGTEPFIGSNAEFTTTAYKVNIA
ncbi:glycoside hydrolase family 12 protein [Lichtheimia corymbifera JMRC:FSU:9682]|uniref:Glycoside hydrolase family 12 protein n=1 Tax=Lichtheimia corymbifera JMRC:FSU:9682 TaxID=1263082 RepID=A0A068S956_9FUNG|nr:glycoside hydrolase family 12 protein [Lichtheimia corymbifera JMRC:FSU:9682]